MFQLCRVDKIPSWDDQSLFANQETNKEAFREVLGIDIDEAHNEQTTTQEGSQE